jgi:glycerol uptake facilitator-like aquaporin
MPGTRLPPAPHPSRYAAEAAGTATVVLVGTLVAETAPGRHGSDLLLESLGFGLGLLVALAAFGEVSGRQFNPAVSLADALVGRMRWSSLIPSWTAQSAGAFVAVLLLRWFAGPGAVDRAVTRSPDPVIAFGVETVLAALFVSVVLAVIRAERSRLEGAWTMAATYTAVHLAGLPLSGGSANPARSLAPAVLAGDFTDLWVYLLGPLLGAGIGVAAYRVLAYRSSGRSGD